MAESVSFDRAAEFYDETRALKPVVAAAVTRALLAEIAKAGANRLLEVGVGTGRISRPLMREGVPVVGVDISTAMMGQLLRQLTPEHTQPDLMLGDATRLPFAGGSFRAALTVHVLHLVSSMDDAIAELRRVLAPGGVLLHQMQTDPKPEALWESGKWWDEALVRNGAAKIRRIRYEDIGERLQASGATVERVAACDDTVHLDPGEILETTRNRINSWSWQVPDELFPKLMAEYEEWFESRYGDAEIVEKSTFEIEVWKW